MKVLNKALIALTATAVLATGAHASVNYGASGTGVYAGAKVGQFDIDKVEGHKGDLTAYGIYGGYNFDPNFGVEAEYQSADSDKYTVGNAEYELKAKTYGAYGTYRYNFGTSPVYLKGKLGVAKTELQDKGVSQTSSLYSDKSDKTGLAGGVAIGFKPTQNFGIEAGYNYLNENANVWGVGAHFAF